MSGVLLSTSGKEQNRSTVREVRCPGHTAHTLQHPTPPRRSGAGSWVSITSCPASTKEKSRSCEQRGEAGGEGLSRGETWIRRQGISHTKVWREPSGDRSPSRSRCGVFKEQKELSVSGHKGSGARPPCMEGGRGVLSSSAKESRWRLCGKK